MISYSASFQECTFAPHLPLKEHEFFGITNEDNSSAVYVLECSTARENVLGNAEWELEV